MLTGIELLSRLGRAAVVVFLVFCITSQPSNAIEGFYVGERSEENMPMWILRNR